MLDVHQHLWPPAFVELLRGRRTAPCLEGDTLVLAEGRFPAGLADHDPDRRLELLQAMGVDAAVVSLQPSFGLEELPDGERDELRTAWLDGMRPVVASSAGRLRTFAPGSLDEASAGAIVPAAALLDLETVAPLLDGLERAGQVLFVHPGVSRPPAGAPAWWAGIVDYTTQMQAAYFAWLQRPTGSWPALRLVFAILAGGAPFQLERLGPRGVDVRSTLDANVFLDTATYGRRAIELCVETFGVHQLVYGSDVPIVDPRPTLDAIAGFGESVHNIVTADNTERLFA